MTDGKAKSFSERLDHLFRLVHPAGKPEFTHEEVADGVRAKGYEISSAYVWQLRRGQRDNPTLKHILGLAAFFGIPPSYFVDDDVQKQIDAQLDVALSMRDAGVDGLANRAQGLSASSLSTITDMIDMIRRLENLPDPDGRNRSG